MSFLAFRSIFIRNLQRKLAYVKFDGLEALLTLRIVLKVFACNNVFRLPSTQGITRAFLFLICTSDDS